MKPKDDYPRICISLDPEFIEVVKERAKKERRPVSQLCRVALEKYFEELDRP